METLRKDIKHAWRLFRENKLFTATAIAALTLGIGVNIAIFSVVNAVLLKPVPFPEPDRLVRLMNANNGAATGPAPSPAQYILRCLPTGVLLHLAAGRNIELNYEQGGELEAIRAAVHVVVRRARVEEVRAPLVRPEPHRARAVERRHQGAGHAAVSQAQGVAELVHIFPSHGLIRPSPESPTVVLKVPGNKEHVGRISHCSQWWK